MKIGYVVYNYPRLSETFVLNEILGLELGAVEVSIFALATSDDPRFHPRIAEVQAYARFLGQIETPSGLVGVFKALRALATSVPAKGLDAAFEFAALLPEPVRGLRLAQGLDLAEKVMRNSIDGLHAHFMSGPGPVACLAHLITGVPFTVTAHAVDIYHESVQPALFSAVAEAAEAVVTVCDANVRFIREHLLGQGPVKLVRIYNGLPLQEVHRRRDESVGARRLIFGAGRFVEKKGWAVLLEACRIMADEGVRFECVLAGEGPERERLQAMHTDLKLEGCVKVLGALRQEQVLEWMRQARVFVAPCVRASNGDQDALPTVLLEALAMGVPVVSTVLGGILEIVEDGVEGLLVAANDPKALAGALRRLMDDDGLCSQMSDAGRVKVESLFDQEKTLPELMKLFSDGLSRSTVRLAR